MIDIGIVMPVYNQIPGYLRIALRSILNQQYRRFRLVIVLDGADAQTVETVQRAAAGDPRVRILRKAKNQGLARALNDGFAHLCRIPSIRYLTWVSSDNRYYPSFLSTLRRALIQAPPRVGLVYSAYRYIDSRGKPLFDPGFYRKLRLRQRSPKQHLLRHCFIGASFLYKKRPAQRIGGYRLEPVEDYDFWLRLTECCDIRYMPSMLMDYRHRSPKSISVGLESAAGKRRWQRAMLQALTEAKRRRGILASHTLESIPDPYTLRTKGGEEIAKGAPSGKLYRRDLSSKTVPPSGRTR